MSVEIETSIAFAALGRNSKRIYSAICDEIARSGADLAPITGYRLMEIINSSSTSCIAGAVRELRALGFVTTTEGHRRATVFTLATDWQAITDLAEAKRIASAARQPPKRKPLTRAHVRSKRKPVEPIAEPEEVEAEPLPRVRPVTLPTIPWPSQAGLALLAENL